MKIRLLALALPLLSLLLATASFADECRPSKLPARRLDLARYQNPPPDPLRPKKTAKAPVYRIYIAPFAQSVSTDWTFDSTPIDSTKSMWGANAGFEFTQPNAIYFGGECAYGLGTIDTVAGTKDIEAYYLEDRIGYTISTPLVCGIFSCTTFLGVGYHHFHIDNDESVHSDSSFWYLPIGLRFRQNFSDTFMAGLNALVAPTLVGRCKNSCKNKAATQFLWKVELPLTYLFDMCYGTIGLSLVPYYSKWAFRSTKDHDGLKVNLLGARLELGYLF